VKKLAISFQNKYSMIGLILGLIAATFLGFIGLAIVIVIALIIFFVSNKSQDDILNFIVFSLIGFVIGLIIWFLVIAAIFTIF